MDKQADFRLINKRARPLLKRAGISGIAAYAGTDLDLGLCREQELLNDRKGPFHLDFI